MKKSELKQMLADLGPLMLLGLLLVGLLLSNGCAKRFGLARFPPPANPCPEYTDLLLDPAESHTANVFKLADRNVCLIYWIKEFKDLKIWESD